MKRMTLKSLIYKNYLKTALTSLLFIEVALIIIYFNANSSLVKSSTDFIKKDITKSVYKSVNASTKNIQHQFNDIETVLKILQNEYQNYFKYYQNVEIKNTEQFAYAPNGMYYKTHNDGFSSVVMSKETTLTSHIKKQLMGTEIFNMSLKNIVDSNEMVIASYFNSHNNWNRYYPFIEESYNAFPSSIEMQNYNFYNNALFENNPDKKVVWTDVYLDPAGQGWMVSAIVPIYNSDVLEGVAGLDITIENMIQSFLSFKLPYNGSSFLIDKNGKIIAMTQEIAHILKLEKFKKYIYSQNEKIDNTIYKEGGVNILNHENREFALNMKKVIKENSYSHNIVLDDKPYLMFTKKFEKTSWYLVSLIDENDIVSEVKKLEKHYQNIGYFIIALVILFYFLFFLYLYKKSKEFEALINTPLLKIIELTKNLGKTKDIQKLESCGIEEIDTLSDNFNLLSMQLEERTKKLIDSELQREYSEQLANTDALTQVYNRRFLEDFTKKYLQIVHREKSSLSLMLIDIDNFKTINDTYGHDFGDKIIVELVRILKDEMRQNDLIVRFGGDEFILLLPNTVLNSAQHVALKLIKHINHINTLKSKKLQFTISIGCAEYKNEEKSIEPLIKRADIALYEAKKLGKNCMV